MMNHFKFKLALTLFILFSGLQVFAQTAPAEIYQQPAPIIADQEIKPTKTARVVVEWATIFDVAGLTKTEILVDEVVICKINADTKICDFKTEPGKREITLNTNLDFGTFSEKYDLQAGKRYKLEVVLNKKNFLIDSLFFGLPVSAIFNDKGKTASLKFELVNVSDEP
jgi:hypothetical protein